MSVKEDRRRNLSVKEEKKLTRLIEIPPVVEKKMRQKRTSPKMVLLLWKTGGFSAMALGFMGVLLPLFPTVPFLLLAVYCFSKGSPQMFRRMMDHKYLGPHLRAYREHRGIRLSVKIFSILFLWTSILSSIIFFVPLCWVRILLLCIAVAITIHVSMLKTWKDKME